MVTSIELTDSDFEFNLTPRLAHFGTFPPCRSSAVSAMSKLYTIGMSIFSYVSYCTIARSHNYKVKYDAKELLQQQGIDTDALLEAGTAKITEKVQELTGQVDQLTDQMTAHVEEHSEWVAIELQKMPTVVGEGVGKLSHEVATELQMMPIIVGEEMDKFSFEVDKISQDVASFFRD